MRYILKFYSYGTDGLKESKKESFEVTDNHDKLFNRESIIGYVLSAQKEGLISKWLDMASIRNTSEGRVISKVGLFIDDLELVLNFDYLAKELEEDGSYRVILEPDVSKGEMDYYLRCRMGDVKGSDSPIGGVYLQLPRNTPNEYDLNKGVYFVDLYENSLGDKYGYVFHKEYLKNSILTLVCENTLEGRVIGRNGSYMHRLNTNMSLKGFVGKRHISVVNRRMFMYS